MYFQLPLMILVIAPAIDGLRKEWREASSNLGASQLQFWRYVGLPVLMPSLLGAIILLFGNAFAAYATAYSLTSGTVNIVPILIGAYYSGNVLDNPHLAQAMAFGMFVVLAVMMLALHPAAAPRGTVGEVKPRRFMAPSAFLWLLLAGAYFFIPLLATLLFSLKSNQTGKCCTAANYSWVIHNGAFWHTLRISFLLALETIVISLAIFVPTIYWVHLKVPRLRPVIAFLALIPFVDPADRDGRRPAALLQGTPELVLRAAVGLPRRRVRDPRVPVHVLLARRGLPLDRRAHAHRGVAEPRREVDNDALQGDHPEHPRRRRSPRRS